MGSSRATRSGVILFAALGASCGTKATEPATPAGGTLPTLPSWQAPPGSIEFYSPILTIPPGADQTWCTFTDYVTTDEMLVHTTDGVQSPFGHHALVYFAPIPEQAGKTVECGAVDMDRFRQMMGGTGGEGSAFWQPPPNVATRVPKGAQFVVQTHWINTTGEPQRVQAHVAVEPQPDRPDTVVGGSVAVLTTNFAIPAHGTLSKTTDCTFDRDHKYLMALPHEHEWGTHFKATVDRKGGGTETLIDTPFQQSWVAHPEVNEYGFASPLVIAAGDTVHVTCDWSNTTADRLEFPREMCVFFGFTLEDDDAHCEEGGWSHASKTPVPEGGAVVGCIPEGTPGNAKGAGEYCTRGGGQCSDNGSGNATICAIDFDGDPNSTATFCTRPCVDDASCGGGGVVCVGDSPDAGVKGCVPLACAPDWAKDGGI